MAINYVFVKPLETYVGATVMEPKKGYYQQSIQRRCTERPMFVSSILTGYTEVDEHLPIDWDAAGSASRGGGIAAESSLFSPSCTISLMIFFNIL